MADFDDLKFSVEALSGGKNTVVLDDLGMPSIMVRIPKFYVDDVITEAVHTMDSYGGRLGVAPHPAFIVNGVEKDEILISKYQNTVINGRAYSLPYKDPQTYVDFDQALSYCYAKGNGWHLMSNAEWAALALWCRKNNFMPRGNNNYGADISASFERGKTTYMYGGHFVGRVATGSGTAGWAHDNTNEGIFDMNGNVWEWVSGMRLYNGEIQIMPDNDAAVLNKNHAADSPDWKAILQDGNLTVPGTANTLKYDAANADGSGSAKLTTTCYIYPPLAVNRSPDATLMANNFEEMTVANGVAVPELMKALALYPVNEPHGCRDGFWARNNGERMPWRGGDWADGVSAGVFALNLGYSRTLACHEIGFRSAFVA